MKKRNYQISLSIMLLLLLAAGSSMANPAVDLGSASGAACNQVIIPITLTNDGIVSVAGIGVDIGYNSQYLTPINATIGPAAQLAGKNIAKNIVSPGLYRILIFSTSDMSVIGNGIIAYVTFTISCTAPLTTFTLANTPSSSTADGTPLPTNGSNGSIQVSQANTTTTTALVRPPVEHMVSCNVCHASTIHTPTSHITCAGCHIQGDDNSPQPNACVACHHPNTEPDTCSLVGYHDPGQSTTCYTCHVNCNTPTTDDHIKQCLVCHPTSFSSTDSLRIHSRTGHSTCSSCHDGPTPSQSNFVENCASCHPLSNPGRCETVDMHSPNIISTCLNCHMNCAGGGVVTTTTTISGGTTTTTISGGTTTTPATTTITPKEHFDNCKICHYAPDLHADTGHNVCSSCHIGSPGPGNVSASECIVCHPTGASGQCNLVSYHGKTCTACHTEAICTPPTTTTSISSGSHTDICIKCHYISDIHSHPQHSNCNSCHAGTPAADNVSPNSCLTCHGPKCTLVNFHGNTCTTCHASCISGTSTTTTASGTSTTTVPPGTCQILSVKPVNGVKLGFGIIPRIVKITVTTSTDLQSLGIIDCDFKFENNPRGIHVLGAKVIGSSIQATVLFVAVKPGDYTILLGDCGSTTIAVSQFWKIP